MNEIKKAEERKPIEWKNQVVITTALLADFYETDQNNVKNNFNRHKENFIEGTHYFILQGEELRKFKRLVTNNDLPIDDSLKFAPQLYLWTERGANRHCKILDTDKSWEQFDNLEKTYFKAKEIVNTELSPELRMLQGLLDQMVQKELADKERDKKIALAQETARKAEETAETIKESIIVPFDNWRDDINSKVREISIKSNIPFQELFSEMYKSLEQKAACDLSARQRNKRDRMKNMGCRKSDIDRETTKIAIIEDDKRLKQIFDDIVRKYAIKYIV